MCPDRELLSAFFDGEVEDPWKSELEVHLKECAICRQTISSFRQLRLHLQNDSEPDWGPARQRILDKILNPRPVLAQEGKKPFWKKNLSIPVPLAAAAAFLLILLGTWFTVNLGGPFNPGETTPLAEAQASPPVAEVIAGEPPQLLRLQDDDLETIIRLIENRDLNNEVIIRLPEGSSFSMSGEPQFIRAADLNGSE